MKDSLKKTFLYYYKLISSLLKKYKYLIKPVLFWQIFITLINFTKLNLILLVVIGIILIFIDT